MEDEKELKPAENKKLKEAWATIKQHICKSHKPRHDQNLQMSCFFAYTR